MIKDASRLPEMVTPVEPSWLERLVTIIGMNVVVETTRNTIYGRLINVEHDHIVLQVGHGVSLIRIQQIISVMPITINRYKTSGC